MADTKLKYLDILPIDETLLTSNTDPNLSLKCKSCLNLGFNSVNTLTRFKNLNKYISKDLNHSNLSTSSSYKSLNLVLESFLINLLYFSTISNFERTQLTSHYQRRKITVTESKNLPQDKYCQNLMFTNFKTWGGFWGSLGYYIHLLEEYKEYLTPSQLVYFNTKHFISISKELDSENAFKDLYSKLEFTLDDSSIDSDVLLFNKLNEVINNTEQLKAAYNQLKFYQLFLPAIIDWYLENFNRSNNLIKPEAPKTEIERKAYKLITEIAEVCLSYSLDSNSFKNLPYSLILQTIPPVFYSVFEEISKIRKQTEYEFVIKDNKNELEKFADLFITNIDFLENDGLVRNAASLVLEKLAAPGGYSLFAVIIAANLVNRAYILTHENNLANSDKSFDGSERRDKLFIRVMRLIYLAGICLRRTNLSHLEALGKNLIKISGINVENIDYKSLTGI